MNIREEQQRILTATKKHLEGALQSADTSLRIVQSVSLPNAYIYDLAERCERSIRTISPLLAYTRYQPEDDSAPADPAEIWDVKMQRIHPTHFLFRLPTLLPHRKEPSSARGAYYSPCVHAESKHPVKIQTLSAYVDMVDRFCREQIGSKLCVTVPDFFEDFEG